MPRGVEALLTTEPDDSVLTDEERTRAETFGHEGRRRQFVLGRTAARRLAAARLGCLPAQVPLSFDDDGAPRLGGGFVSIAHGGRGASSVGAAAVADRAVGIDVERVAPRRPDLWTRLLRPEERPVLDALGGPTDEAQTLLWTLKEAVLKAQRTGFRAGARSVHLHLGPAPEAATARSGGGAWGLRYRRVDDLWVAVAWAMP